MQICPRSLHSYEASQLEDSGPSGLYLIDMGPGSTGKAAMTSTDTSHSARAAAGLNAGHIGIADRRNSITTWDNTIANVTWPEDSPPARTVILARRSSQQGGVMFVATHACTFTRSKPDASMAACPHPYTQLWA